LGNAGGVMADGFGAHDQPYSAALTLPPLSALFLCSEAQVEG